MTKQVALADATYARLKRAKRPGESFSQAIERMLDQVKDPLGFVDRLPPLDIDHDAWLAEVEAWRNADVVD